MIRLLTVSIFSLFFLVSTARAGEFPMPGADYSADQVMSVKGDEGALTMQGKLYHSGKKQRREMEFSGHKTVMIVRGDKNLAWTLMPQNQSYMEHALDDPSQKKDNAPPDWTAAQDVTLTKVGTETVGGHKATKYEVKVKEMGGETGEGTVWLTTEHNIPIKMQGTSVSRDGERSQIDMELKNLKIGKQDASLFEIPSGYQKMVVPQMPMGMPGMAGGKGKKGEGMGQGMGKNKQMGPMGMPEGMPGPGATPEEMEAFQKKMMEQAEQMRKQYGQ